VVEFEIAQVDELVPETSTFDGRSLRSTTLRALVASQPTDVAEKQNQHPALGLPQQRASSAETGRHDQPTPRIANTSLPGPDVDRTVAGARDDRRNAATTAATAK
jgi:hypothetical protein